MNIEGFKGTIQMNLKSKAYIQGKIAYIALTERGKSLAFKLRNLVGRGHIYLSEKLLESTYIEEEYKSKAFHTNQMTDKKEQGVYLIEGGLKTFMGQLFKSYDYIICIMAAGIVVRSIAPYIESKFSDPAILVLDEKGKNVISLLSGHMGGANEMTRWISRLLKANPVITTATDVNEKAALDEIIKQLDAYVENMREAVMHINAALVNGDKVGLYIDGNYEVDTRGFINLNQQEGCHLEKESILDWVVYIGTKAHDEFISRPLLNQSKIIKVIPRSYVLGMGCKKHTDSQHMQSAFEQFCYTYNIDEHAIKEIGSIELKKDEQAMKDLATYLDVPFKVFTKDEIAKVEDLFEGSSFVKQNVGVSCVAEPSAYLLGKGEVVVRKEKYDGITFSLGKC